MSPPSSPDPPCFTRSSRCGGHSQRFGKLGRVGTEFLGLVQVIPQRLLCLGSGPPARASARPGRNQVSGHECACARRPDGQSHASDGVPKRCWSREPARRRSDRCLPRPFLFLALTFPHGRIGTDHVCENVMPGATWSLKISSLRAAPWALPPFRDERETWIQIHAPQLQR